MHYSRTALRELKKRYLNVLKKCFLLNMLMFSAITLPSSAMAGESIGSGETKEYTNETFEGSTATIYGGALDVAGTVKLETGNTFKNNTAQIGGAVFVHDDATVTSTNNTYDSNTSTGIANGSNGGAIQNSGTLTSTGDTFIGNRSDNGGAIAQTVTTYTSSDGTKTFPAGTVTIENGTFTENTATNAGGAIYNDGTAIIKGTTAFNSNTASNTAGTGIGGAIDNIRELIIEGTDVTFTGNTADSGGAIVNLTENATIKSDGATFTNNTAANDGGAIYNDTGATYTSNGDTFINNSATYGGAIYNAGSIEFEKDTIVLFDSNNAACGGGAIYNNGTITFGGDAEFTGNSACGGGAIWNDGTITFGGDTTFMGNSATRYGGGYGGGAVSNSGDIDFVGNATFTGNSAFFYGGAIANWGTITFGENSIATFTNNSASDGGAIINYANGTITFNNDFLFSGNTTGRDLGDDIDNFGGTINFAHGEGKVGTLDGGINQPDGTINKTGAGTLVLGDEMANRSGSSSTFNQSAGLTVAHTDKLTFADTNTITGGELRVHGDTLNNLKATVSNGAMLTYLTTNASEQTVTLPSGLTINNAQLVLGAYTNSAKQAEVNLASSKLVPELDEEGNVVYNDDGSIKYTAYDVTGKLLTTDTIERANYKLNSDIATSSGATLVTFKDSKVSFGGGTITYAGNYALGSNTSMSTANGTVDHLTFNNLQATEHALSIDFGDIIDTTLASVLFDINTINFGTIDSVQNAVSYQALMGGATFANTESFELEGILEGLIASVVAGEQYINITGMPSTTVEYNNLGTTIRSDYNAAFKMANSGTLTDGVYIYQITSADQHPTNPVANSMGKVGTNTKDIIGATNVASESVIQANGYKVLEYDTTTHGDVTLKNLTIDGAKNVVNVAGSAKATVNLNNVVIQNGTDSAISNEGDLTINASNGVAFTNNSASSGGAIGNMDCGSGMAASITFNDDVTFIGNEAHYDGGAIWNSGSNNTIEFSGGATFTNNASNSVGGAIANFGTIEFDGYAAFTNNSANNGGAIYNNVNGTITFGGNADFTGNTASSYGGAIYNRGTIEFGRGATFTNNSGAIHNIVCGSDMASITFNDDATFIDNEGAIYNEGTITFGEKADFTGNIADHGGGAISNGGTITFGENSIATFTGNSASDTGGAIYNTDTITFNGDTTFTNNSAETGGGAIGNTYGTITFNDNFRFSGNTASEGADIYNNYGGTINFAHGEGKVGTLDGGIYQDGGTINKTGAGTLVLGDEMENASGSSSTFNQSAGLTIAGSDTFHIAKDNIFTGGTLETHGQNIGFNASFTGTDANNKAVWKHYSTGGTTTLDNISLNANSEAVFDTYTDDIKQAYINTYVPQDGENTLFTVNSVANGTKSTYILNKDIAQNGGKATFNNSIIKLGTSSYTGAYEIGSTNTINMQNNQIENVTFDNLMGNGATLSIDIIFDRVNDAVTMYADKFIANGSAYQFKDVSIKIMGQSLLDGILSDLTTNQMGIFNPAVSYQTTVLGGNATFEDSKTSALTTQSPYVYEVKTSGQELTVSANKLKDTPLEYLTKYEGNTTLQMVNNGAKATYTMGENETLSTMAAGDKKVLGVSTVASDSLIKSNGKDMFTLNNQNTTLTVEDITIDGANNVVNNQKGSVEFDNVVIQNTTGDISIKNADEMTLSNVNVDKTIQNTGALTATNVTGANKIENTGTLNASNLNVTTLSNTGQNATVTLSDTNTIGTLENNNLTTVNEGILSVSKLEGSGTLEMNNSVLDATSITTNNSIVSNDMTLSDRLTNLNAKTLEIKPDSTLNLNNATATITTIKNAGDFITNKDLTVGTLTNNATTTINNSAFNVSDLLGAGTLNMNNATLDVANSFETENKLSAHNLTLGDRAKELSFAEVAVQENGFLDIGKATLNSDIVHFKDNSKLITHINTLSDTEFGKISANTINISDVGTELSIIVALGEHFTSGYKNFKLLDAETINANAENGFAKILENSMYDIYYLGDGAYQLCAKGSDCPLRPSDPDDSDDLDNDNTGENPDPTPPQPEKPTIQKPDCKGTDCVLDAWVLGDAITEEGKAKEIQNTLNDMVQMLGRDSEKVKDAVKGLAPDTSALIQSHSLEMINRLSSIVSKQLRSASDRTGYVHNGYRFYKYPSKESRAWVQTIYGQSKTTGDKAFDIDTQGIAFGFDASISDHSKIGLAYSYTTADGTAVQRDVDITSHAFMVYGEYNPNQTYVNWQALYARSAYDEDKKVFHHQVDASYDVDVLSAQVILGKKMGPYVSNNWATGVISPEIGLRYTYLKRHGYQDEALQDVASSNTHILTGILGASYSIAYSLSPNISWYPEFKIAATYDLIEPEFENNVTVANGETYRLDGETLDRFGIEIGARLGLDINRKTEVALEYEGLFKGDYENHNTKASLKYKF